MLRIVAFVIGALMLQQTSAQSDEVQRVLNEIVQNNLELQSIQKKIKAQALQLRASNNLKDPSLGTYYLPFGNDPAGEYTEYEVLQSFEFPGVYINRKKLIEKQIQKLELNFTAKKQELLLEAKQHCLSLIILNKHIEKEKQRRQRAEKVYGMMQEQFDKGTISLLELNKAKIAWMEEKFTVAEMETEKRMLKRHLKALNGGKDPGYNADYFEEALELESAEQIWQERLELDPEILILQKEKELNEHALDLSKNQNLPDFVAGYNYQGFPSANVSGFYGGITIPLWSNRHKVKSATAAMEQSISHFDARSLMLFSVLEEQLDGYSTKLLTYEEYHEIIHELNSEEMLEDALLAGEISFIEYYLELQFYRESHEAMLHMEKELRMQKAEILKHQL